MTIAIAALVGVFASASPADAIYAGRDARSGEAPWFASVWADGSGCGAVVVDARYVLTAAHCVVQDGVTVPPSRIVVGAGDVAHRFDGRAQRRRALSVEVHPNYRGEREYDIAKIAVDAAWDLRGPDVAVIGLATALPREGDILTATGWGRTGFDPGPDGACQTSCGSARHLQTVDVAVAPTGRCNRKLVAPSILCTTGLGGSAKNACKGDSGSPVVGTSAPITLVGLHSGGNGCGDPAYPFRSVVTVTDPEVRAFAAALPARHASMTPPEAHRAPLRNTALWRLVFLLALMLWLWARRSAYEVGRDLSGVALTVAVVALALSFGGARMLALAVFGAVVVSTRRRPAADA